MKVKRARTGLVIMAATILLAALLTRYYWPARINESIDQPLPEYDSEALMRFDGTDPNKPIYLALDGLVYDVSMGREMYYGPGESYHYLVGRDASQPLHVFGAEIIKKKYQVVGRYR